MSQCVTAGFNSYCQLASLQVFYGLSSHNKPKSFYLKVTYKLIKVNYDSARAISRNNIFESISANFFAAGTGIYLRVTIKKRKFINCDNFEAKY